MGKICKVPNCKASKSEKLSVFSVPKDEITRLKLQNILACNLDEKSFICERHFHSDDINVSFKAVTNEGYVI